MRWRRWSERVKFTCIKSQSEVDAKWHESELDGKKIFINIH